MVYTRDDGKPSVVTFRRTSGEVGNDVAQGETGKCVGLQTDNDDAVGHRGKGGTTVVVPMMLERDGRECLLQVELTTIVGHLCVRDIVVGHPQTAQMQVFLAVRTFDELLVNQVLSLLLLSVEDIVAHCGQVGCGCTAVIIVGTSAPERVFVELDLIDARSAVYHTAYTAITNRQGLEPYLCGLVVPQTVGVVGVLGCYLTAEAQKRQKGEGDSFHCCDRLFDDFFTIDNLDGMVDVIACSASLQIVGGL